MDNAFFDVSSLTTYANPAAPLLADDFTDGDYVGWTVVDQGNNEDPSIWNAGSGVLRQTSNIHTTPWDPPTWLGTYIWTGDTSWDNYVYSADLGSTDDDAIGMMGRYTDSNNYYRFMWGHESRDYDITTPGTQRRMFDVVVDGVWTTLASDNVAYVDDGTMYNVEMQFIDSRIMVFIDGALIFDVIDYSHSNGAIALYSWGNSNGYYDNVEVHNIVTATSIWNPIVVMDDPGTIGTNSGGSSPAVLMALPEAETGTPITIVPEQESEEIQPVNDIAEPVDTINDIESEPSNEFTIVPEQSNSIVFPNWIVFVAISMLALAGVIIYRRRKD